MPPSTISPSFLAACLLCGFAGFVKTFPIWSRTVTAKPYKMFAEDSAETDSADIKSCVRDMQISASLAAHYGGGWKQTPDALCLRGLAQLLKNNFAETVMEISMAITLKTSHPWRYPEMTTPTTDSMLGMARNKLSPAIGIWSKVDPSPPGKRFAAG